MTWSTDLSAMILAETKISERPDPSNRLAIAVMKATCECNYQPKYQNYFVEYLFVFVPKLYNQSIN